MYNLKDLLNLLAQERGEELRLEPDRPPIMVLRGKARVLDGPRSPAIKLPNCLTASPPQEQQRELDLCGDIRFRYAVEHSGQFNMRAWMEGNRLSLTIKNLVR